MIIDLGCGNSPKGDINIDIVPRPITQADIVCNLGFDKIPLEDNFADEVIAHHFVEHLPFVLLDKTDGEWGRIYPTKFLFDEVYRVLRHDGLFKVTVPIVTSGHSVHQQAFQDFTHVSFWTPETVRYFSGDYYSFHDHYHHTSRFELEYLKISDWFMEFHLRAEKEVSPDFPYQLSYKKEWV